MKCHYCAEGVMEEFHGYEYRGRKLDNISGLRCNICGEVSFDSKVFETFEDIDRKVDGLLSPSEIKSRRKKLKLTQDAVAKELKIPRLTFLRWENGQAIQTKQNNMNLENLFQKYEGAQEDLAAVESYLKIAYTGDMNSYKDYEGYALAAHHKGSLNQDQEKKIRKILKEKKKRNEKYQ